MLALPAQAQDAARTSTYEPPPMFGSPPTAQPRSEGGFVVRPSTSPTSTDVNDYIVPSVRGRRSSPEDAELSDDYQPYIPNIAPPPLAPEPIQQAPAQQGIIVESVITPPTPPLPVKKPAVPVIETAIPEIEVQTETTPEVAAPIAEPPVIEAPERPDIPEPTPVTPAETVSAPAPLALPEQPTAPEAPEQTGIVTGPKTMPAAPATEVLAAPEEILPATPEEEVIEDGALMERFVEEQPAPEPEITIPEGTVPSGFKATPEGENMHQKLMVFEKGTTDFSAVDITFLREELAPFLKASPDVKIEALGFASPLESEANSENRIALSRVMSLRSVLINEGVAPDQLNIRALGSKTDKTPLDRIDIYLRQNSP